LEYHKKKLQPIWEVVVITSRVTSVTWRIYKEARNEYTFIGQPRENWSLEKHWQRWEENIKMDLAESKFEGVKLSQDRPNGWLGYVPMIQKNLVPSSLKVPLNIYLSTRPHGMTFQKTETFMWIWLWTFSYHKGRQFFD
jgi:hypothetical protein